MRLFSVRHEFANEWYTFLNQKDSFKNQVLALNLFKRFPLFTMNRNIIISKIVILAASTEAGLTEKGIGLLSAADIPAPPVSPALPADPASAGEGKNGNLQPMVGVISNGLVQTTFDFADNLVSTGDFMIINPKSNGFQLTAQTLKDLMILVFYHVQDKV